LTSAVVQCVFVRLRQGYGGTAFLASFAVVLRLPSHPLFAELACQAVKKSRQKSDGFLKAGGGCSKNCEFSLSLKTVADIAGRCPCCNLTERYCRERI